MPVEKEPWFFNLYWNQQMEYILMKGGYYCVRCHRERELDEVVWDGEQPRTFCPKHWASRFHSDAETRRHKILRRRVGNPSATDKLRALRGCEYGDPSHVDEATCPSCIFIRSQRAGVVKPMPTEAEVMQSKIFKRADSNCKHDLALPMCRVCSPAFGGFKS